MAGTSRDGTMQRLEADLCVIGASAAGLAVAAGASQLRARVVLVEPGCGPAPGSGLASQALQAAARAASLGARAAPFGIAYGAPDIDFAGVMAHVRSVAAAVAPLEAEERYAAMGVAIRHGRPRFLDRRTLLVETADGPARIAARRFLLATGVPPALPPIPGLDRVDCLTEETLLELDALPRRLLVLGGDGPGCELAQAFRRLGAEVVLVAPGGLLAGEDPELVAPLRRRLEAEGVALRECLPVRRADPDGDGVALDLDGGERLSGSHLLVCATGRPDLDGLGLEAAGVVLEAGGPRLDGRLRTSNRRIFAAGDAAGARHLPHLAVHQAGVVLKNALFRLPARPDSLAVPRVVGGEPALAQVGLTEAEARARGQSVEILRAAFFDNERAQCERETEGLVKAVVSPGGRVLGAGIVGAQAGELILPWVLAVRGRRRIGELAQAIAPWPSRAEASRKAAAGYFLPRVFSRRSKRLVRLLARLG